jgi:hypothetical protein
MIASCAYHNWSYLLARENQIVICTGVSARDGPREWPCTEFKGDIEKYRIVAAKPLTQRIGAECVMSPAVTGQQVQ